MPRAARKRMKHFVAICNADKSKEQSAVYAEAEALRFSVLKKDANLELSCRASLRRKGNWTSYCFTG